MTTKTIKLYDTAFFGSDAEFPAVFAKASEWFGEPRSHEEYALARVSAITNDDDEITGYEVCHSTSTHTDKIAGPFGSDAEAEAVAQRINREREATALAACPSWELPDGWSLEGSAISERGRFRHKVASVWFIRRDGKRVTATSSLPSHTPRKSRGLYGEWQTKDEAGLMQAVHYALEKIAQGDFDAD